MVAQLTPAYVNPAVATVAPAILRAAIRRAVNVATAAAGACRVRQSHVLDAAYAVATEYIPQDEATYEDAQAWAIMHRTIIIALDAIFPGNSDY
jgi:hypothetical protein